MMSRERNKKMLLGCGPSLKLATYYYYYYYLRKEGSRAVTWCATNWATLLHLDFNHIPSQPYLEEFQKYSTFKSGGFAGNTKALAIQQYYNLQPGTWLNKSLNLSNTPEICGNRSRCVTEADRCITIVLVDQIILFK